ncbi:uncharacterized protein LOC131299877 [Rhododendron vialii]|uniref:uncharacterized protein LOC131299877 n=1 Tax=Rhododendron vialii TaxID=182163 RepID=UPI002660023A|nr:uncharacterized protein LOC131299877 [Rhododendron vialii]
MSSSATKAIADAAARNRATALLVALILLITCVRESSSSTTDETAVRGDRFMERRCDEIYVVGEGETLHTISDKCGDPFIVEENPHIQDPDDVYPGLVIKISTPFLRPRKLL